MTSELDVSAQENGRFFGNTWRNVDLLPGLQEMLKRHGASSVELTRSVVAFQRSAGLIPDGLIGAVTCDSMDLQRSRLRKYVNGPLSGESWTSQPIDIFKARNDHKKRHTSSLRMVVAVPTQLDIRKIILPSHSFCPNMHITSDGSLLGILSDNERPFALGHGLRARRLYRSGWRHHLLRTASGAFPHAKHIISRDRCLVEYDKPFPGHAWWSRRWPDLQSPMDITKDPDRESLVVSFERDGGQINAKQLKTLETLHAECCERHDAALQLLCAGDVHPLRWDDGKGPMGFTKAVQAPPFRVPVPA